MCGRGPFVGISTGSHKRERQRERERGWMGKERKR